MTKVATDMTATIERITEHTIIVKIVLYSSSPVEFEVEVGSVVEFGSKVDEVEVEVIVELIEVV